MTSTHTSGSSRRILGSFLVLSIFAAALATAVAAPAAASANLAVAQPNEWQINESEWFINDAPTLHGRSWWGGNLAEDMNRYGQPYGYGPARHNGSSYAYVSEDTGDPADHWARWDMGTREGTQELAVFVPRANASARVRYRITIGSRSTYTDRITQSEIYGWHSLGTVTANGDRLRIEVHYNDSQTPPGRSGPAARTVGVDAMAMRCVSNCSTRQDVPDAPRNVRLQVVKESDGSRTVVATWSPPTDNGGSAITNYRVTFSRTGKTFSTVRRSSSARRHSLTGAWSNTTYKVQVQAENAVGVGPAASRSITTPTPTPSGEAPDAPRNVRLQVVNESDGSRTVVATWSPPTDNGGSAITNYRVTFSRTGKTFSTVRRSSSARRHSLTGARSNTNYKVQVQAENAVGVGPAASRLITTPTPTPSGEAPDAPRNVRLQVVNESDGSRTVVATWSPPTDNGGSAITNYRVTFSRTGKTFSTVRRSSSARRHSLTGARSNTNYKVQVQAENAVGVGSAASRSITTPKQPSVCSGGTKYSIEESGIILFREKRVKASRSFKTVTNSSISRGDEGGKISNASNLSQSGCSWIFPYATVEDNAIVSDNAVIANNAKISDDARVYGNAVVRHRAEIRHNARIYGNATIRDDAEIRESAKIFGNAIVEDEGRLVGYRPSLRQCESVRQI